MTSAATGYDVKVWDRMGYFYDTRAWIPKNVTLVNRAAFDRGNVGFLKSRLNSLLFHNILAPETFRGGGVL
jgi:hypothetical protein